MSPSWVRSALKISTADLRVKGVVGGDGDFFMKSPY